MKRFFTSLSILFSCLLIHNMGFAQQDWPKSIRGAGGETIKIYQPQPESFSNNVLKSRSAISFTENGKSEPVFGMFWYTAELSKGSGRNYQIQSLEVTAVKFPATVNESQIGEIKNTLQTQYGSMNISISQQEIDNSLSSSQAQQKLATTFNNTPPKVIYASKPSILVLIDGSPKLQMNNDWGIEAVVNTPFTIVKNNDGRFYLYGGKHWYSAPSATGPYSYSSSVPENLNKVEAAANKVADNNNNNDPSSSDYNTIPDIIVRTEPAELLQTNGEPNFSPIEETGLLYIKNSSNDIFMDVNSQQYYVLLSGRWYKSSGLRNQWQYIAADRLPSDFAKIPEGSSKDNVLASVAGTPAASNAVMDAQVPQTAKVNRKTATANVTYDGEPEFERITGTHLNYAVNGSSTVLRLNGVYYTVDNGVWFESATPTGPWYVSTTRPDEVDLIPPGYPVYNVKYVYIYDVTPDYVYMGYTPGYLNTYICGPTIVYGTGYYYRPWYRHYYYPRPYTWGFNMNYDPWVGWGFGFNYNFGWFNIGFGSNPWGYGYGYPCGGWWGPAVYRPPYCGSPYHSYGYYGNGYGYRNNININANYTNNVYRYRRDVITTDNRRYVATNNFNGRETAGRNNLINPRPVWQNGGQPNNSNQNRRNQGNIDPRPVWQNGRQPNNSNPDRGNQGNIDPRPVWQNGRQPNNSNPDRRNQGNIDPRPVWQNGGQPNNSNPDRRVQRNIDPRPVWQNGGQPNSNADRRSFDRPRQEINRPQAPRNDQGGGGGFRESRPSNDNRGNDSRSNGGDRGGSGRRRGN